jgi:hypothetical protein
MRIHAVVRPPAAELAAALAKFEHGFSYPLGQHSRFRISHGEDYSRFFRAMGNGVAFVAERNGEVLGTLGAAVRELADPAGLTSRVLYVGDLKVLPGAQAGFTLLRLTAALKAWAGEQVSAAFAVVMDGTRMTPERYTGRFEIPAFREIAKIMVLRLPCDGLSAQRASGYACSESRGRELYRGLSRGTYATLGSFPAERSAMDAAWLSPASGAACGMLEDTRKAKRLFAVDGPELLSAHLSYFAFDSAGAGAELVKAAAALAHTMGFPALFCSVTGREARELVRALGSPAPELAPATVFGTGFPEQLGWHINTSEI